MVGGRGGQSKSEDNGTVRSEAKLRFKENKEMQVVIIPGANEVSLYSW